MLKDQLIKLRKSKKKTQEDIAKYLGISRPAYTAYEAGNRQPDYDSLIKLSNYFDVSLDFLLTGQNKEAKKEAASLLFFDTEGLNDEAIEDIKKHIDYVKWKSGQEETQ